jgi:hypothetical protein
MGDLFVDDILYEYDDIEEHAFEKNNQYIHHRVSYKRGSLSKIEVKERYVI